MSSTTTSTTTVTRLNHGLLSLEAFPLSSTPDERHEEAENGNQHQRPSLLSLPPEILLEIGRLSLISTQPIVNPFHKSSCSIRPSVHSTPSLGTALFRTCRYLYQITTPATLYTHNDLTFTRVSHLHAFLAHLPKPTHDQINSITISLAETSSFNTSTHTHINRNSSVRIPPPIGHSLALEWTHYLSCTHLSHPPGAWCSKLPTLTSDFLLPLHLPLRHKNNNTNASTPSTPSLKTLQISMNNWNHGHRSPYNSYSSSSSTADNSNNNSPNPAWKSLSKLLTHPQVKKNLASLTKGLVITGSGIDFWNLSLESRPCSFAPWVGFQNWVEGMDGFVAGLEDVFCPPRRAGDDVDVGLDVDGGESGVISGKVLDGKEESRWTGWKWDDGYCIDGGKKGFRLGVWILDPKDRADQAKRKGDWAQSCSWEDCKILTKNRSREGNPVVELFR